MFSLSQFGMQLTLLSSALRRANSSSLVLLDEFGQGTSHAEGAALFVSCVKYWAKLGGHSPLILAATHLHDAVTFFSQNTTLNNIFLMSMGYLIENGQLVFLYQPVADMRGNSFPFSVAQVIGIPEHVVSRGKEVID